MSFVLSDQTHIFKLATLCLVLAVDPLRLSCEVHEGQLLIARNVAGQRVHTRLVVILQLLVGRLAVLPLPPGIPNPGVQKLRKARMMPMAMPSP